MAWNFQQWVISQVAKAINHYDMIRDGDKIAVGLSGGKDSLVLLYALNKLKSYAPVKFNIIAVFIDNGWPMEVYRLREFCEREDIPFYYKPTNIGSVVFDLRQEKNPCSLCAKLRRGALNNTAIDLGCNKIALGHHFDDVMETFFLSLFYTGQFRTFSPITYQNRSGITLIRPLIYLSQANVRTMAERLQLPVLENPCPVSGKTKRTEVKEVVNHLLKLYPELRDRFLNALETADLRNLWPRRVR